MVLETYGWHLLIFRFDVGIYVCGGGHLLLLLQNILIFVRYYENIVPDWAPILHTARCHFVEISEVVYNDYLCFVFVFFFKVFQRTLTLNKRYNIFQPTAFAVCSYFVLNVGEKI